MDGDTIHISYNGKDEKVRFIGLDTPETKDPRKPIQCFGREATAKMAEFAENKKVRLEFDKTQGERDKYGRILAFVYSEDNKNLAYEMIRQGYGNEYTYNSNPYKYQNEFKEAARKAREENKGLWAENTCQVILQSQQIRQHLNHSLLRFLTLRQHLDNNNLRGLV